MFVTELSTGDFFVAELYACMMVSLKLSSPQGNFF